MAWTLPISVLSSEFTTPVWLIFGTCLESLLRCTRCERLSLKHEMVNNVSVDIPPGVSPSLRDALVTYEAEGNMDAEDDLPCARWKMAGARTKELSVKGWPRVLVVLVNRWVQDPARKAQITKDSTHPSFELRYEDVPGSYELRSVIASGRRARKRTLHVFWPQWPALALLRRFVNAGGQLQDRAGVAGVHVDVRF